MEVIVFFKNNEKIAEFYCHPPLRDRLAKIFAEHINEYDKIKLHVLDSKIWMGLIYDLETKNFYNDDEPDEWS